MQPKGPTSWRDRLRSLAGVLVIAMLVGLVLPAVVGGGLAVKLREEQTQQALQEDLEHSTEVLSSSLGEPLWNLDEATVRAVIDAVMRDPRLIRVSVRSRDSVLSIDVSRPERKLGNSRVSLRQIVLAEKNIGEIEVEIDDGLRAIEVRRQRHMDIAILLVQIVLSFGLVMVLMRYRLLLPLQRLVKFSDQIAGGNLTQPLHWSRSDEVGRLADQLEGMRASLLHDRQVLEDRVAERTADLSHANDELTKANQKVLSADQAKSGFLASMSHELRTPLNAVLGFSGLLRNEPNITPSQRATLDLINRSGENLLNLINDVLDMSKIEAGGMAVEIDAFDLQTMTSDIVDLMRSRADVKNLRLTLDPASDFPRYVCGDAAKLRQAMINLVGNAIKFTDRGSVTLRVNANPGEQAEKLNLVIEVQDTGVGIHPEDQARVFEPFVQVGHQTTQKGTGLGLSITRKFIELMGGELTLESTPGAGSCFRIQVPVTTADDSAVNPPLNQHRVIGLAPGQPRCRVLVVEDQMENYLLLQRLLENAGMEVRIAENGQLGIEAFESWQPHFIWMDNRMPVMDGITATQHIRKLTGGRDVKIAAVTASAFKDEREQIMAAGMDDFVSKPYRQDEIFDCLTRHLGLVFIRENDAEKVPDGAPSQDPTEADFASLPLDLRSSLRIAVVEMNQGKLAAVLTDVAAQSPSLAAGIERMVAGFRFRELCEALDGVA